MMDLKFDTRDKKPNLYGLLIPVLLAAVIIAVLVWQDPQKNALAVCIIADVLCLVIVIRLVQAFFQQLQYNPYSYNTIFYIGFALFTFIVFLIYALLVRRMIIDPVYADPQYVADTLLNSAKTYMLITFPFIAVFSAALCVSNIALIRHEGIRPVNVLGIILSFLLVFGALAIYRLDYYATGSQYEVMMHDLLCNLLSAVYLYFECMVIGTIIADAVAARHEPEPDRDFVIILGCGMREDGTPTPLLKGRIDRALEFYAKQKAETGRELTFVTSGGQGADEIISESACMKRYLTEHGIPEEQIIEEDRSTDTLENMKYSKEKIDAVNPDAKVAFSTTNYHVFRSGLKARRVKMRALGMGAKTKWYFWPNAAVREFVGLVTEHRGKQALILGSMILAYILMTLYVYR